MPKIDIEKVPVDTHTGYPEEFRRDVMGRERKRLGNAAGLSQYGVNLCRLKPGAASSQRHWHQNEDELVYMLEGEVVLAEDGGETILRPGSNTNPNPRADIQRPSMAQDIRKGRRTEIEFMNGYIADRGTYIGVPAPTHAKLTEIVKKVERQEVKAAPALLGG